MRKLTVHTSAPYDILIGRGCLAHAGELIAKVFRPGERAVEDGKPAPRSDAATVSA